VPSHFSELIVRRLGELGWVVGRDVVAEYRYVLGIDQAGEATAEFVRMKVDVILVGGDLEALAAKQATATIPIVAAPVGDPVGNGLAESLAQGKTSQQAMAELCELIRTTGVLPKRVAAMMNGGHVIDASPQRLENGSG
jgi:hypothetical protein